MTKIVGTFYSCEEYNKLKRENEKLKQKSKEQHLQLKQQGEIIREGRAHTERQTISEKLDRVIGLLETR